VVDVAKATQRLATQTKSQAQERPFQASTHSRTIPQQKEAALLYHAHQSSAEKKPVETDPKPQTSQEARKKPGIDLLAAKSPSRTGHNQQALKQGSLLGQRLATQSLPSLANSTKQLPKAIVKISLSSKEVEQIACQPEQVAQVVAPKSFK